MRFVIDDWRFIIMGLKLPEYARRLGITPKQAWIMYKNGTLPHKAQKISTRTIIVDVPNDFGLNKPEKHKKTATYARVSTRKQETDLKNQTNRILRYAVQNGIKIDKIVEETASGMNGNRPKLNRLLADPDYDIIIEHRERLTRFGYEMIASALKAQGRTITVIDDKEIDDDLVRDMTEILTSFCARLYGKRGAKNKAQHAIEDIEHEAQEEAKHVHEHETDETEGKTETSKEETKQTR